MNGDENFRWFDNTACDRCGVCMQKCPVLRLSVPDSKDEIKALIAGDFDNSLALRYCTTCNICDLVCPQNASPYELILEQFNRRAAVHGLPYFAKMVFPDEPENMWSGLQPLMTDRERRQTASWEQRLGQPRREILLTGFYTNLVPFLTQAGILDDLRENIVGSEGLCGCGGDTNKMGLTDLTSDIVTMLEHYFSGHGVEKVHCFMMAEAVMLAEVLPDRYNAHFDFEAEPLDYWLLDRLKSGKIEVSEPLGLSLTVHDNCLSRYFGGKPQQVVREIAELCGCKLTEMKHCRECALCCGWAATIPTLHGPQSDNPLRTLLYMLSSLSQRLEEAEDSGAEAVLTGCPACYIFLALAAELTGSKLKVLHVVELIEHAAGRRPPRLIERRAWDLLAVSTNLLANWAANPLNRLRFQPRQIDLQHPGKRAEASPEQIARIGKISGVMQSRAVQNKATRKVIATAVKSMVAIYRLGEGRKKDEISDYLKDIYRG
jgi:Fe-S oxidoreductase